VKYAFIEHHAGRFRIVRQCAALGVSRGGYYQWRGRGQSRRAAGDERLLREIRAVHAGSREAYGAFKTWKVLNRAGIACGKHRVARLRRQAGIEARRKRRFRVTIEHRQTAPLSRWRARPRKCAWPASIWTGSGPGAGRRCGATRFAAHRCTPPWRMPPSRSHSSVRICLASP
jgi:hypothetical protein